MDKYQRPGQIRTYRRADCIVFMRTHDPYGGLSNMAGGFGLLINGTPVRTSEALYQACRFPHLPEVQRRIIEQVSPMSAKMVGKPHRANSRPDWEEHRLAIMQWCLRVKLAQNWDAFKSLLIATGDREIVEESRLDAFWGARATDQEQMVGINALGHLLMELRQMLRDTDVHYLRTVQPLDISDFLFLGQKIGSAGVSEMPVIPVTETWRTARLPLMPEEAD